MRLCIPMLTTCVGIASMLTALNSTAAAEPLPDPGHFPAQHWVTLDATGSLAGVVAMGDGDESVGVSETQVILVPLAAPDQRICTRTDAKGRFRIDDARVGVYGLVAYGKQGLASYTVHVLGGMGADSAPPHPQSLLRITMATADRDLSKRMLRSYGPVVAVRPPTHRYQLASAKTAAVENRIGHRIELSADGELQGQLRLPHAAAGQTEALDSLNVMLVQASKVVARTTVDRDGHFRVSQLKPGAYGLIASGTAGFASFGFEAVASTKSTAKSSSDANFKLAAMQGPLGHNVGCCEPMVCEICPSPVITVIESCVEHVDTCGCCVEEEVIVDEEVVVSEEDLGPNNSLGGGGYSSGGFGGGGGGGSGGGLGGLGALAGLAGLAAVLASDDDDAQPASRSFP
ncbi:hypothetical protein EC9_53010 [Rosistilla ulvae]|uniref:Cna protein B-type domain protein n=1 Tax=Rosistilla ulvae TaxID=1930277 RepID=A0A517M867_9BACT|nr:hypothetical protein [Rosistilla ulvae]QDS91081.1 hypothetical protein EC9_53010 [Rosistilla ulvae]